MSGVPFATAVRTLRAVCLLFICALGLVASEAIEFAHPLDGAVLPSGQNHDIKIRLNVAEGSPDRIEFAVDGFVTETWYSGLVDGAVFQPDPALGTGFRTLTATYFYDGGSTAVATISVEVVDKSAYAYHLVELGPPATHPTAGFEAETLAKVGTALVAVGGIETGTSDQAAYWILEEGSYVATGYAIDQTAANGLTGATLDLGSWAADVMDVDGELTILVMAGAAGTASATYDAWILAFRPGDHSTSADDEWLLVAQFGDEVPEEGDEAEDPVFLANGDVAFDDFNAGVHRSKVAPFVAGSPDSYGAAIDEHAGEIVPDIPAAAQSAPTGVLGDGYVGLYLDGSMDLYGFLRDVSGATSLTLPQPDWAGSLSSQTGGEEETAVMGAQVGATPTFLFVHEGEVRDVSDETVEQRAASWLRSGTGGVDQLVPSLALGDVVRYEAITGDGDVAGANSLIGREYWTAVVLRDGETAPIRVEWEVDPAERDALNPTDEAYGNDNPVSLWRVSDALDRSVHGQAWPALLAEGGYHDPGLGVSNRRGYILIPTGGTGWEAPPGGDDGGVAFAAGSDDFSTHALGAWQHGLFADGTQYVDLAGGSIWSDVGAYGVTSYSSTIEWNGSEVDVMVIEESFAVANHAGYSRERRYFAMDDQGDIYLLASTDGEFVPPVLFLPATITVGATWGPADATIEVLADDATYEGHVGCVHIRETVTTPGNTSTYDEWFKPGVGPVGWIWDDTTSDKQSDKLVRGTTDTWPTFSAGSDDFSDHWTGPWTLGDFLGGTAEIDADGYLNGVSWAPSGAFDQSVALTTIGWYGVSVDGIRVDESFPGVVDHRVFAQADDGAIYLIEDGDGSIVPPIRFIPASYNPGESWSIGDETITVVSDSATWEAYSPCLHLSVESPDYDYDEYFEIGEGPVGYTWIPDSDRADRVVRSALVASGPSFDGTSRTGLVWDEDHFWVQRDKPTGWSGGAPVYGIQNYARYVVEAGTVTYQAASVEVLHMTVYENLNTSPIERWAFAQDTEGDIYTLVDIDTGVPLVTPQLFMPASPVAMDPSWTYFGADRQVTSTSATFGGHSGLIAITTTYGVDDTVVDYVDPSVGLVGWEYIDVDFDAERHERVQGADAQTMDKLIGGFDIDVDPNWETITLYDDYHYVHFVYDGTEPSNRGIEHGYWRIDSVSGDDVVISFYSVVDDNSTTGPTPNQFGTTSIPLTVSDAGIDSGEGLMARATDSGQDLVGSWETADSYYDGPATSTILVTFFSDGRYVHYQNSDPGGDTTVSAGYEFGTWVYDGTDLSTTKVQDTNGDYGLQDDGTPTDVDATILVYDVDVDPATLHRVGPQIFFVLPNMAPVVDDEEPVVADQGSVVVSVDEDGGPTDIGLSLYASDAEDDDISLIWRIKTGFEPSNGTAAIGTDTGIAGKVIEYTPNPDYPGPTDSFVVEVEDSAGATSEVTVSVTINPINDPPVASDGSIDVVEDSSDNPIVLGASDIDSGSLTYTIVTPPANGTLGSLDGDDTVTYTPTASYNGSDSFTFVVSDGSLSSNVATVSITVDALNQAPALTIPSDVSGLTEGASGISLAGISVTDPDAGTDQVIVEVSVAGGVLNATGIGVINPGTSAVTFAASQSDVNAALATLTFTPDADFYGVETVSVTADDQGNNGIGGALTDSGSFTVTIDPVNDAPSFTPGANQTVAEDAGPQTVTAWATAISVGNSYETVDQTPSFAVTNTLNSLFAVQPAIDASGNLTYTPADNESGIATVTVVLSDDGGTANGGVDTAASVDFTIEVTAENDLPLVSGYTDAVMIDEDEDATAFAPQALTATDVEDLASALSWSIAGAPVGSITLNGGATATGGSVTLDYDPPADYTGPDDFTLEVADTEGGVTLIPFSIMIDAVNDAPVFTLGPNETIVEDDPAQSVTGFLTGQGPGGGSDEAGQALSIAVTNDANGLFDVQPAIALPSGDLTYTPKADAYGTAVVTVTLTDDNGTPGDAGDDESTVDTFEIAISAVNDPPVNDAVPTIGFAVDGQEGDTASADPGTWNDAADGGGTTITYTYEWFRADDDAGTNEASVGSLQDYTIGATDAWLRVVVTAEDDGVGSPAVATATATSGWVRANNALPTFGGATTITTDEDVTPSAVAITADDADGDNALLAWQILTDGTKGSASLDTTAGATVNLSYVPAADENGGDSVTLRVTDEGGAVADLVVTVTIDPVNDAPGFTAGGDVTVAEDSGAYDAAWATDLSVGPASEAGQSLVGFTVTGNTNGALFASGPAIDASTGNLSFTPADDAAGVATITVALQDDGGTANGGSDTSDGISFDISVTAANDDPVIAVDSGSATQTFDEDEVGTGYTTVSLSADDVDDDNASLTWSITTQGTLGIAVLSGANPGATIDVDYTPLVNANGSDTVVVTVTDDEGATDSITFDLTLTPTNDDPVLTLPASQTLIEDQTGFIAGSLATADVDGDVPTVTITPAGGGTVDVVVSGVAGKSGLGTNGDPLVVTAPNLADLNATLASLSLAPPADFSGPTSVGIVLDDGNGGSAAGSILVTVQAVADAPSLAVSGSLTVDEDALATAIAADGATFSVADADSATLSVSLSVTHGVLAGLDGLGASGTGTRVLVASGSPSAIETALSGVTYLPDPDYAGADVIEITLDDGILVASDSLPVTVTAVNDDPVATTTALAATVAAGGSVTVVVPASDVDHALGALSLSEIAGPSSGTGTVTYAGLQATYTDSGGVADSDSFQVAVSDGIGSSATVTIAITVVEDDPGSDEPPVLTAPASLTLVEDAGASPVGGIAVADQDSATLTLSLSATGPFALGGVTSPMTDSAANINAALAGLVLTPNADAVGSGSIQLQLADGTTAVAATIAVTIGAVNDAPILSALVGSVPTILEDQAPTAPVAVSGFTVAPGGGADEAGQGFYAQLVSNDNAALFLSQPRLLFGAGGTPTLVYGPRANASGSAVLGFRVYDDNGTRADRSDDLAATGTVSITVVVDPANDPPRFTVGPRVVVPGLDQVVTIPGWASAIDGGAGESEAVTFTVAVSSAALDGATLDATGTLALDVLGVTAGTSETVTLTITASDGTDTTVKTAQVVVDATGSPQLSAPGSVAVAAWSTSGSVDDDGDAGATAGDTAVGTDVTSVVIAGISLTDADSTTLGATITAGNPDATLTLVSAAVADGDGTDDEQITLVGIDQTLLKQVLETGLVYSPADGAFGTGTVTIILSDGDAGTADAEAVIDVQITTPVSQGVGDSSLASADADDPDAKAVGDFSLLYLPVGGELTLTALGIDRLVITWDPSASDWRIVGPDEALDPSTGYWIEPGPAIDPPATAGVAGYRMERGLVAGWNPFTVPFGPAAGAIPWDLDGEDDAGLEHPFTVRVLVDTDNDGTPEEDLSLGEAYADGWVEHVVWCLDAAGYTPVIPGDAGPTAVRDNDSGGEVPTIQPGKSYMFNALRTPPGGSLRLEIASTQIING